MVPRSCGLEKGMCRGRIRFLGLGLRAKMTSFFIESISAERKESSTEH